MNKYVRATQLWSIEKGLSTANPINQILKIYEEVAETSQAYIRNQREELVEEIGDIFVTVIIFAQQVGIEPDEALKVAYDKIKDRKGKLVGDSFIKYEDLEESE